MRFKNCWTSPTSSNDLPHTSQSFRVAAKGHKCKRGKTESPKDMLCRACITGKVGYDYDGDSTSIQVYISTRTQCINKIQRTGPSCIHRCLHACRMQMYCSRKTCETKNMGCPIVSNKKKVLQSPIEFEGSIHLFLPCQIPMASHVSSE